MKQDQFILIAYDITKTKVRNKLFKLLEQHGKHVQKSVFEFNIDDKTFLALRKQSEKEIDHNKDSIRYYFLCRRCTERVLISGKGTRTRDEAVIVA